MHKLESEGKLTKKGIPRNPLWLGVAWECIDGYLEVSATIYPEIYTWRIG